MLGVFQELGSYLSRSLSGAQARRPCPGTALKPVLLCVHVRACQVASVMSNSVTAWTVVHQAPLSMEFSRQEYWSGLPCLLPGDLPDPCLGGMADAEMIQAKGCLSGILRGSERCHGQRLHREGWLWQKSFQPKLKRFRGGYSFLL